MLLLFAVVLSGFAARFARRVPVPLLQIACGAAFTWGFGEALPLEPEFFLFFFIPPLLFADARRFPKREFVRLWRSITMLALGLVLFTVLGAGLFIHWLVPSVPLAVAFALAAVLSPTDPVAVSAITQATPVPRTLMHVLEGEALLNDATGLVCLRFAVAAALTGAFSLMDATFSFVLVAFGGGLVGAAVAWVVGSVQRVLVEKGGEETGTKVLVSLLLPFVAYLVAEHLHVSGILAAVAAGVVMPFVELRGTGLAETRLSDNAVWGMLQFALNGSIFVLLGEQLPSIVAERFDVAAEIEAGSSWRLMLDVVAIALSLTVLRFSWVLLASRIAGLTARLRGRTARRPQLRMNLAASFAGVRGAITLAGVLTLPLAMPDGSPFPGRSTAIFLAFGVILVSLVMASVALPFLLGGLDVSASPDEHADEALRMRLAGVAVRRVELAQHELAEKTDDAELYVEAGARVIETYQRRLHAGELEAEALDRARRLRGVERELRLVAVHAEREALLDLRRTREVSDEVTERVMRELDLLEAQLAPAASH